VVFGVLVLGALVVLAVAGVTGATAVLVTVAAIVGMIGLGSKLGARHTPDRAPSPPAGGAVEDHGPAQAPGP